MRVGRTLRDAASGSVAHNKEVRNKKEGVAIMTSKGIALEQLSNANALDVLETNRCTAPSTVPLRLLRFGEVRQRTGLSRSTIWRMERSGVFPRRIQVSVNVVAWREDQVSEWIRSKLEPR